MQANNNFNITILSCFAKYIIYITKYSLEGNYILNETINTDHNLTIKIT